MPAQSLSEEAVSTHVRTQAGTDWAATRVTREKRHTRKCMMVGGDENVDESGKQKTVPGVDRMHG
jgi:hypothetical protein